MDTSCHVLTTLLHNSPRSSHAAKYSRNVRASSVFNFLSKRQGNLQLAGKHRADKPPVAFNRCDDVFFLFILLRAQATPAKYPRNMRVPRVFNFIQKLSRHQSCAWRRRADRHIMSRSTMLTTFAHFSPRSGHPATYPRNMRAPRVFNFLQKL